MRDNAGGDVRVAGNVATDLHTGQRAARAALSAHIAAIAASVAATPRAVEGPAAAATRATRHLRVLGAADAAGVAAHVAAHSFAVVRPAPAEARAVARLAAAAAALFADGGADRLPPMEGGAGLAVGAFAPGGGDVFLDTRGRPADGTPAPLPDSGPGAADLVAGRAALVRIGAGVLRQLAGAADAAAFEALVDMAGAGDGDLSASPQRFCYYAGTPDRAARLNATAFGAHTDTTFATCIPATPRTPGLEVWSPTDEAWYRPEACQGVRPGDVLVLPGELFHAVSDGAYPAAVHRVVRGAAARLSTPMLLRGVRAKRLDHAEWRRRPGVPDGMRGEELWREMQFHEG